MGCGISPTLAGSFHPDREVSGSLRSLMPISILEKLVYIIPVLILYSRGEVAQSTMRLSLVDPVFGILFIIALLRTPKQNA